MIAGITADILVLVHLGFIVFVALGGFLVVKMAKIAFLHLPCAAWGVLISFGGWICPLTPLEMHFRQLAGQAGYTGGFIDHYVMPLIYPAGLTRGNADRFGNVTILAVNLWAYGRLLVNLTQRKKGPGGMMQSSHSPTGLNQFASLADAWVGIPFDADRLDVPIMLLKSNGLLL
jgi:hypothetical protein